MESAKLSIEKRKHPRAVVAIPVRFKLITKTQELKQLLGDHRDRHHARATNLSGGGLALTSSVVLQKKDILKIELDLPGHPGHVRAFAEVVWCKENENAPSEAQFEAGITFLAVRQEDEDMVSRFVLNILQSGGLS